MVDENVLPCPYRGARPNLSQPLEDVGHGAVVHLIRAVEHVARQP